MTAPRQHSNQATNPGATRRSPAAFAAITTIALAAAVVAAAWPGAVSNEFWFWLVGCAVGEAMWLRLPAGNATLSMGSCFNLAALLVLPLGQALLAAAGATLIAELLIMRKPPLRAAFNAAHTVLAVAAGSLAFAALARGQDPVSLIAGLDLLPFLLATLAYYAVNRVAVSCVVALHERMSPLNVWRRNFGNAYEYLSSGAVFSLGVLLAVHYAGIGMAGTLLVILPLLLAFDGNRRHVGGAQERATGGVHHRKAA